MRTKFSATALRDFYTVLSGYRRVDFIINWAV